MFLTASAREIFRFDDLKFPLSLASVRINNAMPFVSVDAIERRLDGRIKDQRVLILGASYREDVGDTRTSASTTLATALLSRGATVEFADPLVESFDDFDVPCHRELPAATDYDVVIFAVAHRQFRQP